MGWGSGHYKGITSLGKVTLLKEVLIHVVAIFSEEECYTWSILFLLLFYVYLVLSYYRSLLLYIVQVMKGQGEIFE
jgi:hypothetical protein